MSKQIRAEQITSATRFEHGVAVKSVRHNIKTIAVTFVDGSSQSYQRDALVTVVDESVDAPSYADEIAASFERVADDLDGAELPELDAETIEAELIEQERFDREQRIADVRRFYGDEAAELVFDGWTVDSAISHVEGTCDVVLCTHPSHDEHAVELVDVKSESMRVAARDVRQGDVVFDVSGGEHVVSRVVHFKRTTRIVRDDRATTTLPSAATITIKRKS